MATILYSIGHSNASIQAFLDLLRRYEIATLVDARSRPYSRYNRHFSREPLQQSVAEEGIKYVYLGKEIGGHPEDPKLYFEPITNIVIDTGSLHALWLGAESKFGTSCIRAT
jgi:hypothetical protein